MICVFFFFSSFGLFSFIFNLCWGVLLAILRGNSGWGGHGLMPVHQRMNLKAKSYPKWISAIEYLRKARIFIWYNSRFFLLPSVKFLRINLPIIPPPQTFLWQLFLKIWTLVDQSICQKMSPISSFPHDKTINTKLEISSGRSFSLWTLQKDGGQRFMAFATSCTICKSDRFLFSKDLRAHQTLTPFCVHCCMVSQWCKISFFVDEANVRCSIS